MGKTAKVGGRKILKEVKITLCDKGHEIRRASFVPVHGRKKLIWVCDCTYPPIKDR